MFTHMLLRNKRGQNTVEYAMLISLVAAVFIGMQVFGQRAMNARVRDVNRFARAELDRTNFAVNDETGTAAVNDRGSDIRLDFAGMGDTTQYEPDYQKSSYNVDRESDRISKIDNESVGYAGLTDVTRDTGGFQESDYTGPTRDDVVGVPVAPAP